MANTTARLEDVQFGLKDALVDWAGVQRDALIMAYNQNAKDLSTVPPEFAAAACFGFATSATEKLFPTSLGAQLLKRVAIPIWLTSEMVSLYNDQYKNEAKDANALLGKDYQRIFSDFYDKVGQAKDTLARPNNTYNKKVCNQVLNLYAQRNRNFKDSYKVQTHTASIIKESGLVETKMGPILDRANAGLGAVFAKVKAIYSGSAYGPGRTGLYLVRTENASCGARTDKSHLARMIEVDDIDVKKVNKEHQETLQGLMKQFAGKSDCVIPVNVVNEGNFGSGYNGKKQAMQILANIEKYNVVGQDATWTLGTSQTYYWPSNTTMSTLVGSFENGLPPEAMTELARVEAEEWAKRG